jgi:chromosome segregation ATPase
MFFCKKLVLLGLGAAGALAVTNAVWSGSVSTAWKKARVCVERQISPEFEISRLRDQIAKLTPDMNRHIEKIAEATVDVASLARRIDMVQGELDKRQNDILVNTEKVERGVVPVGYTTNNLKTRLAADFRAYKTCEKDLANKQKMLEAKKKMLEAARNQLREIQTARATLEVQVAELEAELMSIRTVQAASVIQLDDSRLGQIKGDIEKLRETIDVERTKIELTGQFLGDRPAAEVKVESGKDVVEEVRAYFVKPTDSAKSPQ